MSKLSIDPKVFYGILAVVAVIAVLLVFKGANANQKVPLPDPNMFKTKSAQTAHA
jgi:hypothetical protein